jgi:hypothetical protein
MLCPVCNKEMYDNRESKKNPKAPDYRCKDKECKWQLDPNSDEWIPSQFITGVWLPKAKFQPKPATQEVKTSELTVLLKIVGLLEQIAQNTKKDDNF